MGGTEGTEHSTDRFADDPAFAIHVGGKLRLTPTRANDSIAYLALTYTPGVARVSSAIAAEPELARRFTWAPRVVAVVSDGSAVLGLGDIGPAAALPVMEGKACLFSEFAGLSSVPVVLATQDVDAIVEAVAAMAPSFGGINLEDISAPRCFEIERRLDAELDIPVFHDDQHGTAVVTLAALTNAAKLLGRRFADLRVVISGAGAAGVAITKTLIAAGVDGANVIICDSRGIVHAERGDLTPIKAELAATTNLSGRTGGIGEALIGADVLIGVSGGAIEESALAGMAPGGIIFALANPTPEVPPHVAHKYAAIVATGRSDFPNQINNVLAFPGIFRGALDSRATTITEAMKVAAAAAIADVVSDDLRAEAIVPSPLDPRVAPAVAQAVAEAAARDGVARRQVPARPVAAPRPSTLSLLTESDIN
jgi:malate dehydrogenase (oxaloacetate-decarboxylating)